MNANQFVIDLKALTPSFEALIKSGMSEKGAKRIIRGYLAEPRKVNFRQNRSNELLNLLSEFDLSNVEISSITFLEDIKEDARYFYIGKVELDYLVIKKLTFEIQALSFKSPYVCLWECAANSNAFLEALIVCASFSTRCILDDQLWNNREVILATVESVAQIAGGEKYEGFYKMLLAYF